jgi:tetratricopeptide (TPR) repeat protein
VAIDKAKIAQNAQKLVQKGQFDKALKEYQKLVQEDPKDIRSLLKVAELHGKLEQKADAIATFRKVAEQYNKSGFYTKAVAVIRQAIEVDTKQPELYVFLAELQQKLGLMRDALLQFNTVSRIYQDLGKHEKALEILERMRALDPEDPSIMARYGEALFNAGNRERALDIFRSLLTTLKDSNNTDDLIRFCERILAINPDDTEVLRELSRSYVKVGLANKALLKLKGLFDRNIIDAELYDLLDRAYVLLGKEDKALHAQVEKAKYLAGSGKAADARQTYEHILLRDPRNAEALSYLAAHKPAARPASPAQSAPAMPASPVKAAAPVSAPAPKPAPPRAVAPPPPSDSNASKNLSKFLTEADVYLKYGLKDKAIEQLEGILQHDSNNISARLKLVDIFTVEAPQKAAIHLRAMAEISESLGEIEQAQNYFAKAESLAPSSAKPVSPAKPAQPAKPASVAPVAPVIETDEADDGEIEIEIDDADDVIEFEGDDDAVLEGADEEGDFGDLGSALEDELGDDFLTSDDFSDAPAEPKSQVIDFEGEGPSIREELDEAEFYIQQSILPEAQAIYERVIARQPGHPHATERLQWIMEQLGSSAPAASAQPGGDFVGEVSESEPLFDLAAELEDELDFGEEAEQVSEDDEPPSFEDIFTQFKKGVERELKDDIGAHYDLGIAYKEMGLVNDAIGEFEIALKDSARESESCTMIAICHQQLGDTAAAIDYYQRAIESPSCTQDAALNTNYELACLYESQGDIRNAVAHFKKVVDKDKTYRDVGERIRALKARLQSGKAYA